MPSDARPDSCPTALGYRFHRFPCPLAGEIDDVETRVPLEERIYHAVLDDLQDEADAERVTRTVMTVLNATTTMR